MDLVHLLTAEKKRLASRVVNFNKAIAKFPEGTLATNKNGNYSKYYIVEKGQRKYIPKSEAQLIESLAKKRYLSAELKDAQAEINAIDLYLKHHKTDSYAERLLKKQDGISEILKRLIVPEDETLQKWATEEYPAYTGYPEALLHQGPFGKKFRSKTEANIAYLLMKYRVPYRYEWERMMDGISYPIDFTTRHPQTGRYIYWEHFGRMDDLSYCIKIGPKLQNFESAGIFPGENLILTYESKQFPISIHQLDEIIHRWYL